MTSVERPPAARGASRDAETAPASRGAMLGPYRLVRHVASGPDGLAYAAEDVAAGRSVEVRRLLGARRDPERWSFLSRRVALVAGLEHESVLRVHEHRLDGPDPWLAIEPLAPTLAHRMSDGSLPTDEALSCVAFLADALAEAHRLGLVHGWVCPSLIAWPLHEPPRIDLSDAWARDIADLSVIDLACAAPEVRRGRPATMAADVFALACVLESLVTGRAAVGALPEAAVPADVVALVAAMRAEAPEERPLAHEVVLSLWHAVDATSPATAMHTVRQSKPPPPRRGQRGSRELPEVLGRYRIGALLGSGGMGAVYRAVDLAGGPEVALKVLHPERAVDDNAVRRFRREARVLAELRSPGIARFIDVNEDEGFHYLVMEHVDGVCLQDALKEGPMREGDALAIFADLLRAVAEVHEVGIVHRDIKPANILLVEQGGAKRPVLCDFGFARPVEPDASERVTASTMVIGTPHYMAPEQCMGGAIDARADVYALGATLFRMLAGRPPFTGDDAMSVMAKHLTEPAPDLRSVRPEVGVAVARLVTRSLEKTPSDRFTDARAMLEEIEQIRHGAVADIHAHPRIPETPAEDVVRYEIELDLVSSPSELWPYISSSDRVNRATGLPPVEVLRDVTAEGGLETRGRATMSGVPLAWIEHPFEWVAPHRYGVLREFQTGPFRWFRSVHELLPREGGGTRLRHVIEVAPNGMFGRTAARVEIGIRSRRALIALYRRIDEAAQTRAASTSASVSHGRLLRDPFEPRPKLSATQSERLDALQERLIAHGVDPIAADRLCEYMRVASSQSLARLRPRELARTLGLDAADVIHACLRAAHEGGLVLQWDILCPRCRIPSSILGSIRELESHGTCEACDLDFALDLAGAVEMVFRAHPQIRAADGATYCIGGPSHFPHVVAQVCLAPGERFEMDLQLDDGVYRITGRELLAPLSFRVHDHALLHRLDVSLRDGVDHATPRALRSGRQRVVLTNDLETRVVVRLERATAREDALTAAEAACLPLFRSLFPTELLAPGQLVSIANVVLLLCELADARRMYDEATEDEIFERLMTMRGVVEECVADEAGAVVKMHGDGVMAVFTEPVAAVRAALAILENRPDLELAVHAGPAHATTINERLDYFGRTVHRASALLATVAAGGLALSETVSADPGVAALLREREDETDVTAMHGGGLAHRVR